MTGIATFDVAVIGAGPAGSTAAALLARKDHQVVLIDREKPPRVAPCAGWLSGRAKPLLEDLGCTFPTGCLVPFSQVDFYNADCSKHATPKLSEPVGYLVDRKLFDETLAAFAQSLGAVRRHGEEVKDVHLGEAVVHVKLPSSTLQSRLLLLATGRAHGLAARVGFPPRASDVPIWVAQVETTSGATDSSPARVAVILGLDTHGSFGFFTSNGVRSTLSVNLVGDMNAVLPALVDLCKVGAAAKIMPADLSSLARQARPIRSPAGWALDMDTHVAKHSLLIGDAGGFVAAASNEGLFPAMWSAKIAADVIHQALRSPYSQDELMAFDSQWRMQIADHLRSPHTDIRFLLPLIFSNQAMADRMAAAFFFGDNI